MNAGVLMMLGSFQFSIETAAYQELQRVTEYRWAKVERARAAPARQFTGVGDDSIDLSGVVHPHWKGGVGQIDAMRALAGLGKPQRMVSMPAIGTGADLGLWCIERIEETQARILEGGVPARQQFRMRLSAYGEDR